MTIEKYISALLYRYQCVAVPGFGAFITETISAKINTLSGTIAPPRKLIAFNALLKNNDGLLANHIALEEKISFEKAMELIENQVNIWLYDLNHNQSIYLKNIGEICLNEAGKIIFEPIGSTNYLTSAFGLSPVLAKELPKNTGIENTISTEEKAPKVIPMPTTKNKWIGYAASIIAGLGVLGGTYKYLAESNSYIEKSIAVEKEVQTKVQEKLQQATFYIEAPKVIDATKEIIQQIKEVQKPYHIVAGAFRSDAKAEILANELREQGFANATYLKKEGRGMRNVIYNSYETAEEAQKELQKIVDSVNKNAWIFVEKQ